MLEFHFSEWKLCKTKAESSLDLNARETLLKYFIDVHTVVNVMNIRLMRMIENDALFSFICFNISNEKQKHLISSDKFAKFIDFGLLMNTKMIEHISTKCITMLLMKFCCYCKLKLNFIGKVENKYNFHAHTSPSRPSFTLFFSFH